MSFPFLHARALQPAFFSLLLLAGAFGFMTFFSAPAKASERIGYIKTLKGTEHRLTDHAGQERPVAVGTPLLVGDTVYTGKETALGLTLKDETLMSIGPNTELTLQAYLFEPARGELSLSSRMNRGTMQFVSGQIARLKPEAVAIDTPAGTIGVRGTHFALKVSP